MRVAPKMGRAFSQGRVRWYLLGLLSPAVGSSSLTLRSVQLSLARRSVRCGLYALRFMTPL